MPKILVIDDDPDIALATRLTLESGGYTVIEAHNSKDGLDRVLSEKPDLIVLDVMMDSPTAGFQTALALRSHDPDSPYADFRSVPILMLTSVHQTTPLRFSPDESFLPVDAFMDKPLVPEKFLAKVAELLKVGQPG